jgi:hypothetical protein
VGHATYAVWGAQGPLGKPIPAKKHPGARGLAVGAVDVGVAVVGVVGTSVGTALGDVEGV